MVKLMPCLALIVCFTASAQQQPQEYNVSGILCERVSKRITPGMVGRAPMRYVDSCIEWSGDVVAVVDADPDGTREWVIPVEGGFAYCGSTRLTIDGVSAESQSAFSSGTARDFIFLCSHISSDIDRGDEVIFEGKILGVCRTPDPQHKARKLERILVAITKIHAIGRKKDAGMPFWW